MQNQNQVLPFQYPMQRPKKHSRDPENWKQCKVKKARVQGHQHINYKGQVVQAKVPNDVNCHCIPPCTQKFTAAEKNVIFANYHSLSTHEEQTLYLRGCIVKTNQENNSYANSFYLRSNNVDVLVCQKYFLGILSIKRSRLRRKVLNTTVDVTDRRGKHNSHVKLCPQSIHAVRDFFNSLETRESHYSRQSNKLRKYLESHESISSLYQQFITAHNECSPFSVRNQNEAPRQIRKGTFEKIFNFEFNIAFGCPRSDICEQCEKNKVHQKLAAQENDQPRLAQLNADHEIHLREAQQFYTAMYKDEIDNLDDDVACFCFDFEKNLPLPVTNVTREFFARRLWLYNFGIHDLRGGPSYMYIYSETYSHKGSNEVISALKHYMETVIPPNIRKIHMFSDNSAGQNKNKYLLAFLSTLNTRFDQVTISFAVVGHSRMACDRDFALIEGQRRKHDKFYFPSEWTQLIRNANTVTPFRLVYLEHPLTDDLCDDGTPLAIVFNFKAALDPLLKPPAGIMKMKGFSFDANGEIRARTSTTGPYNLNFDIRKPQTTLNLIKQSVNLCPRANNGYIPLRKVKYDNIQMLLANIFIPEDKIFYETLKQAGAEDGPNDAENDLAALLSEEED